MLHQIKVVRADRYQGASAAQILVQFVLTVDKRTVNRRRELYSAKNGPNNDWTNARR
jgi:hypothetical protein